MSVAPSTWAPMRGLNPLYPCSDGKPMADNTIQADWIRMICGNLQAVFAGRDDVFVASDNLVYPVEGSPRVCLAPDVYVAFGVPTGHRASYLVWEEGVFPQVVWEVRSPRNRTTEMQRKLEFYERHGAEEYYDFNPQRTPHRLAAYRREGGRLVAVPETAGYVSPRLGIRFEWGAGELRLVRPDGTLFRSYLELNAELEAMRRRLEHDRRETGIARRQTAAANRRIAAANAEAEEHRRAADENRRLAEEQRRAAEEQKRRADAAEAELAALRARLAALGLPPGPPPL